MEKGKIQDNALLKKSDNKTKETTNKEGKKLNLKTVQGGGI